MLAYLLIYQVEKGVACLHLQVFSVIANLLANQGYDLGLHLRVASENVERIEKDIALLHVVFLREQQLHALALC